MSDSVALHGKNGFIWNTRKCYGNDLHFAILQSDLGGATAILDESPDGVGDRFVYFVESQGQTTECSGCPIHIAASRQEGKIVELLLSRRASVESWVRRGRQDYYDVLHAAVFAEGRGGTEDMINCLIHAGSNIRATNSDGQTCKHLAFRTGNLTTIEAVRQHEFDTRSCWHTFASCKEEDDIPLRLGIQSGKMNKDQLARAASPKSNSLKTFMHLAPECIPMYLKRILGADMATPEDLVESLDMDDFMHLMREFSEGAMAVLDGCTARPHETSYGWHALPARVSFGPRTRMERLWRMLFPQEALDSRIVLYPESQDWEFDEVAFQAPEWHRSLTDRSFGPRLHDAEIKVCYWPNLISTRLFLSLSLAKDESLGIYNHEVLQAAIDYAFEHYVMTVEVFDLLLTFWTLLIIMVETWLAPQKDAEPLHADSRLLEAKATTANTAAFLFTPSLSTQGTNNFSISADLIVAKGIVDLTLEALQFLGAFRMEHPEAYASLGNLWDIFTSLAAIALLWHSERRSLHTFVVVVFWIRLLHCITVLKLGRSFINMKHMSATFWFWPATSFTLLSFCAFTHAMYILNCGVDHPSPLWPDKFRDSFTTLLTASLPKEDSEDDLELVIRCAAAVLFTVLLLNVFITVIGNEFTHSQERSRLLFYKARASSCLAFLLRSEVLPQISKLCFFHASIFLATLTLLSIQALNLLGVCFPRVQLPVFVLCLLTLSLSAMHGCDLPDRQKWWRQHKYLWIVTAVPDTAQDQSISGRLDTLDQRLEQFSYILERMQSNSRLPSRNPSRLPPSRQNSFYPNLLDSLTRDSLGKG